MTYHVVCNRRGEPVATVLSLAGVRVPRGGWIDTTDRPAPVGHRWCGKRKGYHEHEEEAAHHTAATREPVSLADAVEALSARLSALENKPEKENG